MSYTYGPPWLQYQPNYEPSPRYETSPRWTSNGKYDTKVDPACYGGQTRTRHSRSSAAPRRVAREATEPDKAAAAKKYGVPDGCSLERWDPSETPFILLASVFDFYTLGKWIYDWTIYRFTAKHPMSEVAGAFWILLIQLFGNIKSAEEEVSKIRGVEKKFIEDFIKSGERHTKELRKLLKSCEPPMLESGSIKDNQLGLDAGIAFVDTLWGRDRELEHTKGWMTSVRLWNSRFEELRQGP